MASETYILVEQDRQQNMIKKGITCVLGGDKNCEEMCNSIQGIGYPVVGKRVTKKDRVGMGSLAEKVKSGHKLEVNERTKWYLEEQCSGQEGNSGPNILP